MEILEKINQAILNTTIWEWIAVITGLLYVILISFKKTSAWFFAIVSSLLYIYLCYSSQLFLETGFRVQRDKSSHHNALEDSIAQAETLNKILYLINN